MSTRNETTAEKVLPGHQNLTPNERAIIERIRIPVLRNLVTGLWRVKLRLQFTGWLQYIIPATLTLAVWLVAGLIRLFGGVEISIVVASIGILLLAVLLFDLVTVKFRLRPHEHRPERNDRLDVFDLMRARSSCRSFQTRKMTDTDREELIGYMRTHSSDPTIGKSSVRFEYVSAPLTVWPTVNATEFLVAIAPKEYDRLAVIDVGHSLQKIVMDATRMGLGTCWIGPGADHKSIAYHLGNRFDPEKDHIICVCAVGYKSRFAPLFVRIFNAQMHHRLPLSSLFFEDAQCHDPLDLAGHPWSRFERTYEICQWAPSSYNGQTTRCAAVVERNGKGGDEQLARFDFYSSIESRYYAPVAVGIWCANWELGCAALGIRGHFAVLSPGDSKAGQNGDNPSGLPKYELSWMMEDA